MLELLTVIVLLAMLVATAVLVFWRAVARTDMQTSAEILKQDIRKAVSLADSGTKTNGQRDRYRVEIHSNAENPGNTIRILKGTYNGTSWGWAVYTNALEKRMELKVVGNGWARISNDPTMQIQSYTGTSNSNCVDGANNGITFISRGSVLQKDVAGNSTIVLRDDTGTTQTITISENGAISD